jgi:galactokinase
LELIEAFRERYGKTPRLFRAPGRVNIIGEHTDYNDGFVLPMAIDRETVVAITARSDRILKVWSLNLADYRETRLDNLGTGRRGTWMDYIEGVAAALSVRGRVLSGAEIALISDIPIGSGLSSSAALEMSIATALAAISGVPIEKRDLALAGQTAEHVHVGIQSGIMDQYTSIFAQRDHALLLDCRSLESKPIPLNLGEYRVVICDSRVRHNLAASEYNERRQDCERGVEMLRAVFPGIRALRDVSLADFERHQTLLPETIKLRCRHVISENARTLQAAEALASGDLMQLACQITASHVSLRDDYQVSCRELDLLTEIAESQPGVLGARMTGGGFGGCTINLVAQSGLDSFQRAVSRAYCKKKGFEPEVFVAQANQGASEIL